MRIVSLLFVLSLLRAASPIPQVNAAFSDVVISEVAWMGTSASTTDEWLELYNTGDSAVSIDGWKLTADDGTPSITLSGSVPAGGFFLLERTDDDTVPNKTADQIYTGPLSNTGETLRLVDSSTAQVDLVDAASGWPAGDNDTKQTMERALDGSWMTSAAPGGTPGAANSVWQTSSPAPPPSPTPSPPPPPPSDEPAAAPELEPTPPPASPSSPETLRLSELLPDPEGKDSEGEFVELYNYGIETVVLDGWKLRDADGKTLTLSGTIAPGGYALFRAKDTSLPSLNNGGDTIELITPSGTRRDGIAYGDTREGWALALTSSGVWQWTQTPTPGSANVFSSPQRSNTAPAGSTGSDADIASAPTLSAGEKAPETPGRDNGIAEAPPLAGASRLSSKDSLTKLPRFLGATAEQNGEALAAAIRSQHTAGGAPPLAVGALAGLGAGALVFLLRVWARRKNKVTFMVEKGE